MIRPSKETVTLEGDALAGVGPRVPQLSTLPQQVRLGRVRRAARPPAPRLSAYFDEGKMAAAPPPSTERRAKAASSLARMYLNDRYGCCVISGKAHALGLWSGADAEVPVVLASDREILDQYHGICGPGDNGCVITDVLDVMRASGFVAGGKRYKIDGYVSCDWTNKLEVQVALYLFGATTIGINLPDAWTSAAVWDVTNSRIVGGHDVTPLDYDERGVYVSSWGRVYLITWAAFTSRRWLEEFYVLLAPLWYGADSLAPSGVNVQGLRDDLAKLGAGVIPPLPDPQPQPPPPPTPGGELPASLVALNREGREVARYYQRTPASDPRSRADGEENDPA